MIVWQSTATGRAERPVVHRKSAAGMSSLGRAFACAAALTLRACITSFFASLFRKKIMSSYAATAVSTLSQGSSNQTQSTLVNSSQHPPGRVFFRWPGWPSARTENRFKAIQRHSKQIKALWKKITSGVCDWMRHGPNFGPRYGNL